MTTWVVFIQRWVVVVAILLCYFNVQGVNTRSVNCEVAPYHKDCRGTMARKRTMFPTYGSECEDNEDSTNCLRQLLEERYRPIPYVLSKSKLLKSLLNNDLQKDIARSARHKLRNDESYERESALIDNFLSELESSGY